MLPTPTSQNTGELLGAEPTQQAYIVDGRPVAGKALAAAAPVCGVCKQPAIIDRIAADGFIFHHDCFRCVHCKEIIGERRFVWYDEEPYLDGCYQKLFGSLAEAPIRALMQDEKRHYALMVPLQAGLGPHGLANFARKHAELAPEVKRGLREHGVTELRTFLFHTVVTKPSFIISFAMPVSIDATKVCHSPVRLAMRSEHAA